MSTILALDQSTSATKALLFSPAEVYINNATSGRTFQAGAVAPDLIRASLLAQ